MTKSVLKCPAPNCKALVYRFGEQAHKVYDISGCEVMPDAIAKCVGCGAYTNGKDWRYYCEECGKQMHPSGMAGLQSRQVCKKCQNSDR